MSKLIDLTGQRFGRLIVIKRAENGNKGKVCWLCKCDCGKEKIVQGNHLREGSIKSCGCLEKENLEQLCKNRITHNETKSRLYNIWASMKHRCNNVNNPRYNSYGGRGITIYEDWNEHYESFRDWALVNGYKENLSIDRINNNEGYYPSNCRWILMSEQARNKRNNHIISYNGQEKTIAEFAEEYNLKYATLWARINVYNWDIEKALLTPTGKRE